MRNRIVIAPLVWCLALAAFATLGPAPGASAQTPPAVAPTLIPLSGELRTPDGQPRTGNVLLVVSLYEGRDDTAPRWIEHQAVTLDASGRYSLNFGGTREEGLPADLFVGAAATRWVGVAVENESEQPRVALVSVPYAAKAASADMLSGKPLTDFVLTSTLHDDVRAVLQEDGGVASAAAVVGTLNYLQKGDGAAGTLDSVVFETGGNVGIGTITPLTALDVAGSTSNSSIRAGGLEFQSYSLNNHWIGDNLYYNSGFRYRSSGKASQMYFDDGGLAFFTAPAGTAGAGVPGVSRFTILNTGNVGVGVASPTAKLHVGGSLRVDGNLGLGTTSGVTPLDIAGSTTNSSLKAGGLEFQSFAANNHWIADNLYYNVGFRYRANGTASQIYFDNGDIGFFTAPLGTAGAPASRVARLVVRADGNVGIGTMVPTAKLHVVGATTVTGNLTVDGNIAAKYQDVAEWVDAAEPLEPGTIVIIDPSASNRVAAASRSYDTSVAGAVSPQPGLTLGEPGEGKALVAQSGRVRIKVDASFGAIRPGDLLVSSPTKGHAMRSSPGKVRPGTVIGKALEAMPAGRGEILTLLTLQ